MSLYSQNVSNNPLSLDGLITGNFDVLYVDGQPVTPTDTSGLVPYTGATTAVDLNSKKITTTYVPVDDEDLTNKLYVNNTFLAKSGFNVSSGGFVFDTGTIVQLNGSTYINCSVASFVGVLALDATNKIVLKSTTVIGDASLGASQTFFAYNTFSLPLTTNGIGNTGDISTTGLLTCSNLDITGSSIATPTYALGINGSNRVVRFAGGTGDAVLSAGTLGLPQQFTGYNYFANLLTLNGSINFSSPVSAGTATYILGVNSGGNLVSTTTTSAPTQLTVTNHSTVAGNYYPVYIKNTATGVRDVYSMDGAFYEPITQIWEATNIKSAGTTTCVGTLFTQSGITNTAGQYLITDNLRSPNTGMTFIIPSASATFGFQNNTTELLKIDSTGITVSRHNSVYDTTMIFNTSGPAVPPLPTREMSFRYNNTPFMTASPNSISMNAPLTVNTIQSFTSTDLTINVPTATNFLNFNFNGINISKITNDGFWIPSNGGTSFYITDTAPRTGTTAYGRYFGLGTTATIYQDFYNRFLWRSTNLAGTTATDIMYLRSSGLNINQSTTTHPTLDAYELVVGNNSATYQSSAKILVRGKSNVALTGPSIDFVGWDSHISPQASIECIDDNFWGGIINFHAKPNGAGAGGAMAQIAQFRNTGFVLKANTQGTTTDCLYTYASTDPNNLFQMCQHETVMFTYDGNWAVPAGRYLGNITKHHQGSKIRCVATATQYSGGAITLIFSIGLRHVSTGAWTYLIQNTFTNIGSAHWVCPNIGMTYNLPAGSYEVYVYGNQFTDANDYVRIHLTISPA